MQQFYPEIIGLFDKYLEPFCVSLCGCVEVGVQIMK
jgi:hypothetical protein